MNICIKYICRVLFSEQDAFASLNLVGPKLYIVCLFGIMCVCVSFWTMMQSHNLVAKCDHEQVI